MISSLLVCTVMLMALMIPEQLGLCKVEKDTKVTKNQIHLSKRADQYKTHAICQLYLPRVPYN